MLLSVFSQYFISAATRFSAARASGAAGASVPTAATATTTEQTTCTNERRIAENPWAGLRRVWSYLNTRVKAAAEMELAVGARRQGSTAWTS